MTFRLAETREDLEGAFRLVYRNYVELNYCKFNRFRIHFYLYDALPETRTLVAHDGEKVVGTLTLVFDSELGLPSESLYKSEIDGLREAGRKLVEVSKLATDRELGRGQIIAVRGLFRLAWLLAASARSATDFCIMVEPHHEKFYRRTYLFERLGELREDPKAGGAASILMRLDLETAPDRMREAFGEDARPRNLYWYNCLAPELEGLRRKVAGVDRHLTELNRRAGGEQSSSDSMRRYSAFRLFAVAFNVEKISTEAEEQRRKGLFDREIDEYTRLLSIMPSDYAPERQAKICLKMANAAWHCGSYERMLELCGRARDLTDDPDIRSQTYNQEALGLHFTGKRDEAITGLTNGLAAADISPLSRAKLLRTRGRLYIEALDMNKAREDLAGAGKLMASAPGDTETNRQRAVIQQTLWIVESHSGDYVAARRALREAARYLPDLSSNGVFEHYMCWCDLERISGRPLEALAHLKQAQRLISADADLFKAAVLEDKRVGLMLSLGDLDAARASLEVFLDLSERSKHIGVIADAIGCQASLMAREDRVEAARELLEKWLVDHGSELSERPRAQLLNVRAYLAAESGLHEPAASLYEEMEKWLSGASTYLALARVTRVANELHFGRVARARELTADLAAPSKIPGHETYRAAWEVTAGLFGLLAGQTPDENRELLAAELELYRRGEAWGDLASSAVQLLRALKACGLRSCGHGAWEAALCAGREATGQRRLPLADRLLDELAGNR
jgi:tetratricopeptide (TPR) repeat protein